MAKILEPIGDIHLMQCVRGKSFVREKNLLEIQFSSDFPWLHGHWVDRQRTRMLLIYKIKVSWSIYKIYI